MTTSMVLSLVKILHCCKPRMPATKPVTRPATMPPAATKPVTAQSGTAVQMKAKHAGRPSAPKAPALPAAPKAPALPAAQRQKLPDDILFWVFGGFDAAKVPWRHMKQRNLGNLVDGRVAAIRAMLYPLG
jgi:hypothetical protein